MDAAITAAVGLGGALLGVVGGFWGAFYLEYRRETRRRLGVIAALLADLTDNYIRAYGLAAKLEEEPEAEGPFWDFSEPVSGDLWRMSLKDAGSFIPFDLFYKMRTVYIEQEIVRGLGDHSGRVANPAGCIEHVNNWMKLNMQIMKELISLPEAKPIWPAMADVESFVRDRRIATREAVQGSKDSDAKTDVITGE